MFHVFPDKHYPKEEIDSRSPDPMANRKVICTHAVIGLLDALLLYSAQFYSGNRYQGLVSFNAELTLAREYYLQIDNWETPQDYICLEDNLRLIDRELPASSITEARTELLEEAISTLVWGFGYKWVKSDIDAWMKKHDS